MVVGEVWKQVSLLRRPKLIPSELQLRKARLVVSVSSQLSKIIIWLN